ncbi:MAG: hypothetical protein HWN65_19420 [Candidatus Helarchaeota archaeon]|nr:hypothetical protein [Candidatus Helarchaeota archaeon]
MTEENEEIQPFTFNLAFFITLYFIMTWFGLFPSVLVGYWFFITFPFSFTPLYLVSLIPLFFVLYGIALLSSLISTKIGIWFVHKRIAYPKLGSFRLLMDEPQTRAWVLKGNLKNFGRWLYYFFHLEFLRAFWMRRMGVKIGKNVRLGKRIVDEEFIEIGDNTFMSRDFITGGHMMDNQYITIFKSIIGKNCIFKSHSGVVGGKVGDNSIIENITGVMKGQICRGNAIYLDVPCKKVGDNDLSQEEIEELKQNIIDRDKINWIKQKNAPIKINEAKLFIMKILTVIGGCLFAFLPPYLYSLFFQAFYSPANQLLNIALLTLVPFIFFITIGFFIIGTTLFIKGFIVHYDRKAEISEGYYELDDPRAKYFKIKYFLRLFGIRLFHGTPFSIADTFAMRFWGKVKFGEFIDMEDAIVDPQYLEVGDHSIIATLTRVHTHDIINGKLYIKTVKIGKNVMVGGISHLRPGVEIVDGSVIAAGAWFRKNRKCKRPALWIGKPAFELPLSMVTKSARLDGKYVD